MLKKINNFYKFYLNKKKKYKLFFYIHDQNKKKINYYK